MNGKQNITADEAMALELSDIRLSYESINHHYVKEASKKWMNWL